MRRALQKGQESVPCLYTMKDNGTGQAPGQPPLGEEKFFLKGKGEFVFPGFIQADFP